MPGTSTQYSDTPAPVDENPTTPGSTDTTGGTTTGTNTGTTGSGSTGTTGSGGTTGTTGGTSTSGSFHDVRFPTNISFGATGGPKFSTVVIDNPTTGWEQRIVRWDQARLAWECQHQLWDADRIRDLIAFFRARKGKAYAFRFKDWSDYYAGMGLVVGQSGPQYLGAASAQAIGTGDGARKAFQLVKTYASGGVTHTRRITRPIAATVKVYVGPPGALVEVTSGWTLNDATGVLTFANAPAAGQSIAWAGQFDVPARFDTDEMQISIEAVARGNWPSIPIVEIRE